MASNNPEALQDDELIPESVEGYHVGEKKTIEEYTKLDAEDESLAKWKASLGLSDNSNAYPVKAGDKRKVVIVEMSLQFPNQPELQPIVCYPEGNFGRNQLLDGSISLSPLYPNSTIDLHVRTATSLHQSFLWLHPIQA